MNTEQLKTGLTKEEIFKQAARKNFISEAQPNISIEEVEKDFDEMMRSDDPEEIFVLKTITTAMQDFASQESRRAVDEFKETLRRGLFRLDMYGPDNMVKMKEFEDLIDKL